MRALRFDSKPIALVTSASALPFPPAACAVVPASWSSGAAGVVPELDLELWTDADVNLTGLKLYAATSHPLTIAGADFTADHTTGELHSVAHGLLTGDGPLMFGAAGGALPTGLAAAGFAIRVGVDDFKLAASLADALAGNALAFTDDGSGTLSFAGSSATQRLWWNDRGLLGDAGDGAVALTADGGGWARPFRHAPRALAYALVGTLGGAANISATIAPLVERD